jgi:sugar phosphate isomerase/epimerase
MMRLVYFTKLLKSLDVAGLIGFCQDAGLAGVDLAIRPGYPIHPDNVAEELPRAAKAFAEAGLTIGMATTATDITDANSDAAKKLFDACAKAGVRHVKIGYFPYKTKFDETLAAARKQLAGWAKLAEKTGVKACYHTHSGNYLGNNAAGLRLLLADLDPHHVGAMWDTGHAALNGGPPRMELDSIRSTLSLVAIKDMVWKKDDKGWKASVVPSGQGIVRWNEVREGLEAIGFRGTITLHGEYDADDVDERKRLAKAERAFLEERLGLK